MAERLSPANAVATAAILYVLITLFGRRSGAHFNPVVTGFFWLKREIATGLAISYVIVRLLGAVGGVWIANAMFDLPVFQVSTHIRTGMGQGIGEAVATFGLIMTILGGKRQLPGRVPVLVAAWVGAACWFTSSTSFANPAVTLARAFTNTFTGIAPQSVTGFVLAQLVGAFLAAAILPRLFFGTWFGVNKLHRNQRLKE